MLEQCLLKTFGDDIIEDYISPITNERKGAKQTILFGSFPDFLFVQLKVIFSLFFCIFFSFNFRDLLMILMVNNEN